MLRRDSVGIRIVESAAPAWTGADAWTIDPVPEAVIGTVPLLKADAVDSESAPLERVVAVRVLSDGRIFVADDGAAQVLVFDGGGRLLSRIGRKGKGPGEFDGITDVHACAGDTIVVAAGGNVNLFDPEGRFLRRANYRPARTWIRYAGVSGGLSPGARRLGLR